MNWKVIYYCFILTLPVSLTTAQVYNRGAASFKKSNTPKPAAQKKVIPKAKININFAPKSKAITNSKPNNPTKKKLNKDAVEHKFTQRKVAIFPKLIYPDIRVDIAGFQTNIKGFVPVTVLFKLRKTSKEKIKATEYTSTINKVTEAYSNTYKLEIVTPKTMPPGYYDIYVLNPSKKSILIASNIMVHGIISTSQSFFALVQNGVVNAYPKLTIRGYGFGSMSKANYVYLDKMRLSTIISWNDTFIELTIPYWVNTGASYTVLVHNSKGVEVPKRNADPSLRVHFTYKGINANFFNAELNPEDVRGFKNMENLANLNSENGINKNQIKGKQDNSKLSKKKLKKSKKKYIDLDKEIGSQYLTILQIKGLGFGKNKTDSKVYLNSTEARQIISWSDTLITIKATSFRPGKYISKIFINPNDRKRKIVYSSRDSFYVWGRIPYKLSRIVGSCYTISLKKSELPTELVKKEVSYIYTLPQDARAELALYDADGKNLYAKFFSDEKIQPRGRYKITYNSTDLTTGKYLLIFTVNRDKYMKVFHPVMVR